MEREFQCNGITYKLFFETKKFKLVVYEEYCGSKYNEFDRLEIDYQYDKNKFNSICNKIKNYLLNPGIYRSDDIKKNYRG